MMNTKWFGVFGTLFIAVGLTFFLPFYLIQVKPGMADYKNYNRDVCHVNEVTNRTFECTDISTRSCGCGDVLACSVFIDKHVNGTCCSDSECCSEHSTFCTGGSGGRHRHCTTRCVAYSLKLATLTWGYCYDMTISYDVPSYNITNRTDLIHCHFNDLDCVKKVVTKFAVGNHECFVDQRDTAVKWSRPSYPYGWWVGASFGIAFLIIGAVLFLVSLYKYTVEWCNEHIERENGKIIVHVF